MILKTVGLLFCCWLLVSINASALTSNETQLLVTDQSEQTLKKVLPQAFSDVLIKMNGNADIIHLPGIQKTLTQADRYVSAYHYTASAKGEEYWLTVAFDLRGVKRLLKQNGQGVWNKRPVTLVWLKLPKQNSSFSGEVLASDNESTPIKETLEEAARSRGIPIMFPVMDLQDQVEHTPALPNKMELETLLSRYEVSSILAGALMSGPSGGWEGEWQLYFQGSRYEWQTSGATIDQVIQNSVDRVAEMMAAKLAMLHKSATTAPILMHIRGVENFEDYLSILSHLKKLTPITNVQVGDVREDHLLLQIQSEGGTEALMLALKNTPYFVADDKPAKATVNELFYRWQAPVLSSPAGSVPVTR